MFQISTQCYLYNVLHIDMYTDMILVWIIWDICFAYMCNGIPVSGYFEIIFNFPSLVQIGLPIK